MRTDAEQEIEKREGGRRREAESRRWEDEGPVRPVSSTTRPNASEQRTASNLALVEHFRQQEIGA